MLWWSDVIFMVTQTFSGMLHNCYLALIGYNINMFYICIIIIVYVHTLLILSCLIENNI